MSRYLLPLCASLACLELSQHAAADPRFDVVPAGVMSLSGDGCFVMSDRGFRWQNGASTPIGEWVSADYNFGYSIAAMTPDASVIVGQSHSGGFFRLENGESTRLVLPSPSSRPTDISHDGQSLLLNDVYTAGSPAVWMAGVVEPLAPIPSPAPWAWAAALSADANQAGGVSRDESGYDEAVIWDRTQGTLVRLGKLPGHIASGVLGLSADGSVAVGHSGNFEEVRAFRWDGTGLLDLGPLAAHAYAASADGSVVVGSGPQGAFVWDAQHGTRRLRDVLEQVYHLDLGNVSLDEATLVSDDGKTIAGRDFVGGARGWRVSLHEERCGSVPPVDLLWDASYELLSDFERPSSLAVDSQQRVYVSGYVSRNVIRVDGALTQYPPIPPVEVLDLKDDAPPGIQQDVPIVLGVGPDDAIYVSAYARQQLLRIDPDGDVEVVFDGSDLPPVPSNNEPLPTSALGLAVSPDGTLFVAAYARLLRIDPDGQAHELLDALDLTRLSFPEAEHADTFIYQVVLSQDSIAVVNSWGAVFMVHPDGGIYDVSDPGDVGVDGRALTPDSHGSLWFWGGGLGVRRQSGLLELIFHWEGPEITGITDTWIRGLVAEPRGSLLYTDGHTLVRREADGRIEQLLTSGSPTAFGPLQAIGGGLTLAGSSLYWAEDVPGRIVRYDLGIAACDNGVDDDGDGAIDFPADAGCSSAQDDGEHVTCENGIDDACPIPEPEAVAMLVAGAVLLAGLDRRRARMARRRERGIATR